MERLENRQTLSGRQDEYAGSYSLKLEGAAEWLLLEFTFEQVWSSALLRDPSGKLRVQYMNCNNKKTVVLHREAGRSSYLTLPGVLPPGEWRLELLGGPREFTLNWKFGCGEAPETGAAAPQGTVFWTGECGAFEAPDCHLAEYPWHERKDTRKRWYKGDFHAHTILSDGKMTPEELTAQAALRELDFFVATDHNLFSTAWPHAAMLVIPGMEVTSTKGHYNAIGLRQWLDWRPSSPDGGMESEDGMNRLLVETKQAGALRSMNHPMLKPWAWEFRQTKLGEWDAIEIWNDPTYATNPSAAEKALKLWSALWNAGYRITGIGGSDVHALPTESYAENGPPSLIGDPATYVYAEGLSAADIMRGVQGGHVYVTRGPILEPFITARSAASGELIWKSGIFGEEVMIREGSMRIRYRLAISNLPSGKIHWIENGEEVLVREIRGDGYYECEFLWDHRRYAWRRAEIRTESGELLAFTNPIFVGSKVPELLTWGQLSAALEAEAFPC